VTGKTKHLIIMKYLLIFYLSFIANSFAGNWDMDHPSLYVANVYYDGEMIASIQRLSTKDEWNIYCLEGERYPENTNLSYKNVNDAFHDSKKKCKLYP
jgi:hypothetical protein